MATYKEINTQFEQIRKGLLVLKDMVDNASTKDKERFKRRHAILCAVTDLETSEDKHGVSIQTIPGGFGIGIGAGDVLADMGKQLGKHSADYVKDEKPSKANRILDLLKKIADEDDGEDDDE